VQPCRKSYAVQKELEKNVRKYSEKDKKKTANGKWTRKLTPACFGTSYVRQAAVE
jgi:hypothetical protein